MPLPRPQAAAATMSPPPAGDGAADAPSLLATARLRRPAGDHGQAVGEIAGRFGEEVARPLTKALERLAAMSAAGRVDAAGIAALREDIERARRVGIMGQQLARLACEPLPHHPELLDLRLALRDALQQRTAELLARGLEVRQRLQPVRLSADPPLLLALLLALLDWALPLARTRVELGVETAGWPQRARLVVRVVHRDADEPAQAPSDAPLDSVAWRLLRQTASALGACAMRADDGHRSLLTIDFPSAEDHGRTTLQAYEAPPMPSLPPGTRVLVVAAERAVRVTVQAALRRLPLAIDSVDTAEAALLCCHEAAPRVIVHDVALDGLEPLRRRLRAERPALLFIGVTDDDEAFEVVQRGAESVSTIGRGALVAALPAALQYGLGLPDAP